MVSLDHSPLPSGSSLNAGRGSSLRLLAAVSLAGVCLFLLLPFSHLRYWQAHPKVFYYDQGLPLMTTFDAYHYLQLTADLVTPAKGKAAAQPSVQQSATVPLLARMTAAIHRVTQSPIERVAFYLPPILASLTVLVYVLWGNVLGGPLVAFLALLAEISSSYWYSRTCLGRFDTDCLNPFFVYMIAFWVYQWVAQPKPRRYLFFVLALGFAYLFGLWWVEVRYLGFFIVVLVYGLSVSVTASKWEKALQSLCLAALLAVAVSVALGWYSLFPRSWSDQLRIAMNLFDLVTKQQGSMFAAVGQSISELQPLSWSNMAVMLGGGWPCLLASVAGLLAMTRSRKQPVIFLSAGFMLGLASWFARRFLIFWVPLYALGMGYFLGVVVYRNRYFRRFLAPVWRVVALALLTGVLLFPGISRSWLQQIGPAVTARDVALARTMVARPGSHPVIWSWWDYGYFLRYITGEKTFIDGGSQSAERTFVAAFPLSCQNPLLARNWMRFFACHDLQGLALLRAHLGSTAKALGFLQIILAKPTAAAPHLLAAYGFKHPLWWQGYLFPHVQVWLFLDQNLLNKAYWWYYFGTWNPARQAGIHPEILPIEVGDPSALRKRGLIRLGDHLLRVEEVVTVGGGGESTLQMEKLAPRKDGMRQTAGATGVGSAVETFKVAVCKAGTHLAYVMNDGCFKSLACCLFFDGPLPQGLYERGSSYRPWEGGVWRVE